jgi:hypothetical protein
MLWNPKWKPPVVADPFALETLIAWLEKQPADSAYDFYCIRTCAAAQYAKECGFTDEFRPTLSAFFGGFDRYHVIVGKTPHTFGAALSRARSLLTQKAART